VGVFKICQARPAYSSVFTLLHDLPRSPSSFDLYRPAVGFAMILGALRQAVLLGLVSVALLSAAALGGGGCPPPGEASPPSATSVTAVSSGCAY